MTFVQVCGFTGACRASFIPAYLLGNGYRGYLLALMRFNAPDSFSPFGIGGLNPYAYCAADPINKVDPSGHAFEALTSFFRAMFRSSETAELRSVAADTSASDTGALLNDFMHVHDPKHEVSVVELMDEGQGRLGISKMRSVDKKMLRTYHKKAVFPTDLLPETLFQQGGILPPGQDGDPTIYFLDGMIFRPEDSSYVKLYETSGLDEAAQNRAIEPDKRFELYLDAGPDALAPERAGGYLSNNAMQGGAVLLHPGKIPRYRFLYYVDRYQEGALTINGNYFVAANYQSISHEQERSNLLETATAIRF